MKLKYIEFVFENCDSIKIEGKYIGDFLVDDFKTSIKRIACNSKEYGDITSIQFELEEDYVEEGQVPCREYYDYYVNWAGDSEYINEAQKTYLSKEGNLYIVIADGADIEEFFDLEEIEDGDYMDFHFSMCDVGDEYSNPDRYKNVEDDEQKENT